MKRLNQCILLVSVTLFTMLLTSCGKNEREKIITTQEIQLGAADTIFVLQIGELMSAITEVTNDADWLMLEIMTYTSDAPAQLKVTCLANNTPNERSAIVFVRTKEGDEVTLKVIQNVNSSFDTVHDINTDQPSLAPIKK